MLLTDFREQFLSVILPLRSLLNERRGSHELVDIPVERPYSPKLDSLVIGVNHRSLLAQVMAPIFGTGESEKACGTSRCAANADDSDELAGLESLEARVNALLPPQYQSCFETVSPKSMGSAALKYDAQTRVAWDQIWTHFCDLALAGGPPHRGTLLEAPTPDEVEAEPAGYQLVYEEIIRGIRMTSGLTATVGPELGWVTVECQSQEMAAWLLRAVMAENVFTRRRGAAIQMPAGPTFRIVKEVKNVVVALAKTSHYWKDHISSEQKAQVANTFASMGTQALLEPPSRPEVLAHIADYQTLMERVRPAIHAVTGLPLVESKALGWVGVRCRDEKMAAWFVRSAIVENILARREEDVLYLPLPKLDSAEQSSFAIVERMTCLHRYWSLWQQKINSRHADDNN